MNASSPFASSPQAGALVVAAVVLFTFAALAAIWTIDLWILARRDARARDLKAQRRSLRESRVAQTARPIRNHAKPLVLRFRARVEEAERTAERARESGVDEMVIEDLTMWAERSR